MIVLAVLVFTIRMAGIGDGWPTVPQLQETVLEQSTLLEPVTPPTQLTKVPENPEKPAQEPAGVPTGTDPNWTVYVFPNTVLVD